MNVAQDLESWKEAFQEPEPFVRSSDTEALIRQFAITADDSEDRCNTNPKFKEKHVRLTNRTVYCKLHDDDDAKETELVVHDARLETR